MAFVLSLLALLTVASWLLTAFLLLFLLAVPVAWAEVHATVLGEPEVVFRYATDHCETADMPDNPVRAFRRADGQVVLVASNSVNYQSVGPTLGQVYRVCQPTYASHYDPEQLHARYAEWVMSPYTLDGVLVHALVHAEWYAQLLGYACRPQDGWVNAITQVQSINGGRTYAPASIPVWVSPVLWQSSYPCTPTLRTRYGASSPSNIVYRDGYYYALFTHWADPDGYSPETKTCVMRTANLADATAWQVWTDQGWSTQLSQPCKVVAQLTPSSLSWNTYLRAYLLIGDTKGTDRWYPGVYLQMSQNLVTWTIPQLLLSGLDFPQMIYPSLLDETTNSRNFEVTGQNPYFYFVRFNDGGLDRDLLRQRLYLERDAFQPLVCAAHGHHDC